MSTPGANMSTQRPVLLQGYIPAMRYRLRRPSWRHVLWSFPMFCHPCAAYGHDASCLMHHGHAMLALRAERDLTVLCFECYAPAPPAIGSGQHHYTQKAVRESVPLLPHVPRITRCSPSWMPAGEPFWNLLDRSDAAILSVPLTLPGAMVQLSVLALPAATTTVICTNTSAVYFRSVQQLAVLRNLYGYQTKFKAQAPHRASC